MKDLRTRRSPDLEVDLEGPAGWNRGRAWDSERPLHHGSLHIGQAATSARAR